MDRALAGLAAGLAMLLYGLTAAPWLTWAHDGADGGDLIAGAMTWGVPHPSGYPTYCLLGRLFATLPLGPIARRFNLFSATAATVSTGLVHLILCDLLQGGQTGPSSRASERAIAFLAALTWASGYTLWSQATIAEVYALGAAFAALCLYLVVHHDHTRGRHWLLLGLALGLGLGVHLTMLLLVPGLLILRWPRLRQNGARHGAAFVVGILCGFGAYLYLPVAARHHPPVNWGDPRTLARFWWMVSGGPYRDYLGGLPLRYLPSRVGAWLALWRQQYTVLGFVIAVIGLEAWIEHRGRWALASIVTVAAYSAHALLYDTADSYVYLIPAYLVTILWLAEGARALYRWADRYPAARWAVLVVLALVPSWSVVRHYEALDLSRDREARVWMEEALGVLPEGALLITTQDRYTFAMRYVRWVEGRRPDLVFVDADLLRYSWYAAQVESRWPELKGTDLTIVDIIDQQRRDAGCGAVHVTDPPPLELQQSYTLERQGPLWHVTAAAE